VIFSCCCQNHVALRSRQRIQHACGRAVRRQAQKNEVSSKGGHVVISKTNFSFASRVFLPLTLIVIFTFAIVTDLDWKTYRFILSAGRRAMRSLTLNFHVLRRSNPTSPSQGYFVFRRIIFLGNVCVLLFGIPC